MSVTVIRGQLIKSLPETEHDEKLLEECISICQNYNISGTELFYKWEAKRFGGDRPLGSIVADALTLKDLEELKKGIVEELNKKRLKEQNMQNRKVDMMAMLRRGQQTNSNIIKASTAGSSFNGGVKTVDLKVTFKEPVESKNKRRYRYMYEKTSERSEILDERIDEFAEIIREHYNLDELGDPSATTEEGIAVVGRICGDADSNNQPSKLSDSSVFLESSRMMGSGARVSLRFSPSLKLRGTPRGAGGLGLFPGAIVALKGRNGGGGFFVVDEILGLPCLGLSPDPPRHKAFTLAAACGPYTVETDLKYNQLDALIQKITPLKPAVLLLSGPFIDSSHPLVKSGEVDQTPSEIFNQRIVERLQYFLSESPHSLVLLQPSIRDVLSDHPVFPQCEMNNTFFPDPRIKMLPNPYRFSVNGVSFASTSVDVLFHLRNQEYLQRGQEVESNPAVSSEPSATDVLTNTCRHLLYQRTFYPVFPVPAELTAEVNLDVSHMDGLRLDENAKEYAPDVLILPSRLKQFTKMVDSSWAINSSFATKGTFAVITVPDIPREELPKKLKCEIVRV